MRRVEIAQSRMKMEVFACVLLKEHTNRKGNWFSDFQEGNWFMVSVSILSLLETENGPRYLNLRPLPASAAGPPFSQFLFK